MDADGNITPQLAKALEAKGVNPNLMTDAGKDALVEQVRNARSGSLSTIVEDTVARELRLGNSSNGLAGLKLDSAGRAVRDDAALSAMKIGVDADSVQQIKRANPATKKAMGEMVQTAERLKGDSGFAATGARPSDIAGEEVVSRLKFVKSEIKSASRELKRIAETDLKNIDVDPTPVRQALEGHFREMGGRFVVKPDGSTRLDFSDSLIKEDKSSQRLIKKVFNLVPSGAPVSGRKMHNVKLQIDALVDFTKGSKHGLAETGRATGKKMRFEINSLLRNVSPEYASVNDIISRGLGVTDNLQKAIGKSIKLGSSKAGRSVGTGLRGLFSNNKSRGDLSQSLDDLDKFAQDMGGDFVTDYRALALFDDALSRRTGSPAKTSFQGGIEAGLAAGDIATGGASAGVRLSRDAAARARDRVLRGGARAAKSLSGPGKISDSEYFNALRKLIKQSQ